ncbi:winged helix-turn-helix domain-containing protein [Bacillus velezensis]
MLVSETSTRPLSRIQFRLLYYLALHSNKPVSKATLIKYAWGEEHFASKNNLYVYINQIRKLVERDTKRPKHILCLRKKDIFCIHIKQRSVAIHETKRAHYRR